MLVLHSHGEQLRQGPLPCMHVDTHAQSSTLKQTGAPARCARVSQEQRPKVQPTAQGQPRVRQPRLHRRWVCPRPHPRAAGRPAAWRRAARHDRRERHLGVRTLRAGSNGHLGGRRHRLSSWHRGRRGARTVAQTPCDQESARGQHCGDVPAGQAVQHCAALVARLLQCRSQRLAYQALPLRVLSFSRLCLGGVKQKV